MDCYLVKIRNYKNTRSQTEARLGLTYVIFYTIKWVRKVTHCSAKLMHCSKKMKATLNHHSRTKSVKLQGYQSVPLGNTSDCESISPALVQKKVTTTD